MYPLYHGGLTFASFKSVYLTYYYTIIGGQSQAQIAFFGVTFVTFRGTIFTIVTTPEGVSLTFYQAVFPKPLPSL